MTSEAPIVDKSGKGRILAYFNAGNGLAAGLGALLGGYFAPHLPAILGYQTLALFLVSGIARGLVTVVFIPQIREVRKVSKLSAAELFHMLTGGRPINRRISHRRNIHVHHDDQELRKECKPPGALVHTPPGPTPVRGDELFGCRRTP